MEEDTLEKAATVASKDETRTAFGDDPDPDPDPSLMDPEASPERIDALVRANEALVRSIASMRARRSEELAVAAACAPEEDAARQSSALQLLQAETESLQARKRGLQMESDGFAAVITSLAAQKSGLAAETEPVLAEKSFLENALALSDARTRDFLDELLDLDRSNASVKEQIGTLELETERLKGRICELRKETEASRNQCNAQESENSKLHELNAAVERQLEDSSGLRAAAERQASEKEAEIEALQSEVLDSTQTGKRLKAEISHACSDISTLRSHHFQLLSRQEELETQICELRSKLQSAQSRYEAACFASDEERKLAKSLLDLLDASHANSRRLEEELTASKTVHSKYRAADEKDQAQISTLENKIGSFLNEKAELQEVKRALEEELDASTESSSKLANLREKVKRLEAELNKAREEAGNSDRKARRLVSDLEVSRDFLMRKSALSSFSMPLAAISTVTLVAIAGIAIFKHSKRKH